MGLLTAEGPAGNDRLTQALERNFGWAAFRPGQRPVVEALLAGQDCLAVLPTGGGKSLCYQLPALIQEGTAIVISPLIALMKNQVDAIRGYSDKDHVAHFLNSSLNKTEQRAVKKDLVAGHTKLLYVAPETLTKQENIDFLASLKRSPAFDAVELTFIKDAKELGRDMRKFQITDIARLFRVPPHMIADLDRATFSNIEQQSLEFVMHTMTPWAERWESSIEADLLPDGDALEIEFDFANLMRGDAASRSAYYQSGIQNGWLTRNEARISENLNPIAGLDQPLRPLNMVEEDDAEDACGDPRVERHLRCGHRGDGRGPRVRAPRRHLRPHR